MREIRVQGHDIVALRREDPLFECPPIARPLLHQGGGAALASGFCRRVLRGGDDDDDLVLLGVLLQHAAKALQQLRDVRRLVGGRYHHRDELRPRISDGNRAGRRSSVAHGVMTSSGERADLRVRGGNHRPDGKLDTR